jgi:hypothetical protein
VRKTAALSANYTGACGSTRRSLLERHHPVGERQTTLEQTPHRARTTKTATRAAVKTS